MRIQHNIAALNSYRQLGNNNNAVSKNLEKLSSGYRINRAGDDAAGLAISEKMRAQITGLETAKKNAQDGISLVQTAEGNLTEVHSMLNRMVELASQSANGTYQDKVDRENIQKEVESLKSEINRIADSANYNGIKLLDGTQAGVGSAGGLTGAPIVKYKGAVTSAQAAQNVSQAAAAATKATYTIDFTGLTATGSQTVIYNGVTVAEGTTAGFAAANNAVDNAKAITDAWKADAKFTNYDIAVDGTKVTLTAKDAGVDANAAAMNTAMTGSATITSKAVTETAKGADAIPTPGAKASYTMDFAGLTLTGSQTVIYNGVTLAEGTTPGLKLANDAATNTKAIADAWKANGAFMNYDIAVDGTKVTLTMKEEKPDANAAAMKTAMTGSATITNKAVTETSVGVTPVGIDYFKKDTINVDGTDIKVDWSKLDETQRKVLQKDWTQTNGSVNADDAQRAAKILQDTINEAVQSHNAANGTNIADIKVTAGGGDTDAKTFTFASGQKDGESKITFTGTSGAVLGQMFGANEITSAEPVRTLSILPQDLNNGEFTMKVGDQSVNVKLTGLTAASTADDLVTSLNNAITAALTNFDTAHGLTGSDTVSGKIKAKLNADGALEFTNTTSQKIAFEDKEGGEIAKTLGISTEGKASANGGLTLQVGDTSDDYQQVTVSIASMKCNDLGIEGINVGTQESAKAAIDKIKNAINTVSSTRGDLGAIQNRLDHTINNLGVTSENMTAAESRIRDVDMAQEMMDFTKNNILSQAAQAMLAQANQIPQGVLQLLQ